MKKIEASSALMNRDAVLSTVWSIIQQLVVATSTYCIVEAIRLCTEGQLETGLKYIVYFTISLILVYVPNTISVVYLQKWRLSSVEKFVHIFARQNKGQTTLAHSREKQSAESWITHELFTVFDTATNLIYQILSTLMNSAFNVLVIAIVIDKRLIAWYLGAGFLLIGSNYLFRKQITNASNDVQNSRRSLSTTMLSAWQNIFVGNSFNYNNWMSAFHKDLASSRKTAVKYDLVRSLISSGTVILSLLIIAFGNGLFIFENMASIPAVAALLVTLPRQLQIIQSIFALFNLSLSWSGVSEQLKSLGSILDLGNKNRNPESYIKFDEIDVHHKEQKRRYSSFKGIKNSLQQEVGGRFTVRGRNGAGKSTLLSLLKEQLGEDCFLLPTNFEGLFFGESFLNHSDGNRLLTVFEEIVKLDHIKVVVLDEWDANLDATNIGRINEAIGFLSESKVVIESRHRHA